MTAAWLARLAAWTLLHFLWQALLPLGAFLLARRLLRPADPRVRYLLALGTLVTLALLPVATAVTALAAVYAGTPAALPAPLALAAGALRPVEAALGGAAVPLLLWLAGIAVGTAVLAAGHRRLARLVREARPLDWCEEPFAPLADAARRAGGPALLASPAASGPLAAGWRRPAIVLPAGMLAALAPAELRAVLLHELAHLRRRDYAVNLLQRVLEILFWFHPAVRLVSAEARAAREQCCDDEAARACGRPLLLARALVSLEELRAGATALAFAGPGDGLGARVRRLLATPATPVAPWRAAALGLAALIALLGAGATTLTARAAGTSALLWRGAVITIRAEDPAGPFTVELVDGRVRGATLDGAPVPAERLVQQGHTLHILDARARPALTLAIAPGGGGIRWSPRAARAP